MEALILGVGDAFTARHFGSSALLRTGSGGYILVDCPDLIHRALHEACGKSGWSAGALDIDDVIITHLHGDHSNGLETFGFFRRIAIERGMNDRVPRLHASTEVLDRVWEKLAPAMDGPFMGAESSTLEDFFEPHVLRPEMQNAVGGTKVEIRYTRHPVPTTALRIVEGGSTLGWSSDTPYDEELLRWLATADVIVHECNLGAAHTPLERLNEQPEALRSRLRLIHTPDDFDPSSTSIPILRQGDVLTL